MDEVVAFAMTKDVEGIRAMLIRNGVNASNYTTQQVQIAFLKAIKDSQSFRDDLSSYMANTVQKSFVSQPQLGYVSEPVNGFVNEPMLNAVTTLSDISSGIEDRPAVSSTPSITTSSATSTTTKTSFWDTLGSLASKDNLQSLFNTGLTATSAALQNKANKDSEERALELERIKLEQIQAQKDLEAQKANSGGMPTWGWVLIILGGVGLLVFVLFKIFGKKKS